MKSQQIKQLYKNEQSHLNCPIQKNLLIQAYNKKIAFIYLLQKTVEMRGHKAYKSSSTYELDSDSGDQFTSVKIRGKSINAKGRKKPQHKCLQSNLLYATNLPLWFEDDKAIKDQKYFGQYGTIIGIMSSTKRSMANNNNSPQYVQSYITYKDERDVAIVIATINDMMCFSLSVKTTYGTSRLCNNYVNGKRCTVKGCFWLHDEKNVIKFQGPFKADFEKQRLIAYEVIRKNLSYYIDKIESKKPTSDSAKAKEEALVRFPSIKETIDKLIEKKVLSKFTYEKAYEQYLATKKKMSETVKKIVYVRKRTASNAESDHENDKTSRTPSVKEEPVRQEPQVEPLAEKKVNMISAYFKANKKEKNEFLMSGIMQSLQENEEGTSTKPANPPVVQPKKQFVPLISFTDFFTNKLFQQQQLMDTQESQSGDKSTGRSLQQKTMPFPQLQLPFTFDPPLSDQDLEEQKKLVDRVKSQILKGRLVKVSMLQFTESIPFLQNVAEFQKVTKLLKSKLVGTTAD